MPRSRAIAWSFLWSLPAAAFALHRIREADPLFHLTLGRAVWRAGSRVVPEPTAFSDFTAPNHAPEWLWEVINWLVYSAGGWTALSWLAAVLAALAAFAIDRALAEAVPAASLPARLFISGLAMIALLPRITARPQIALAVVLPLFLACGYRLARAPDNRRMLWSAWAAALTLVWAQLHGSFVLALPVLFACTVPREFDPRSWRRWMLRMLAPYALVALASASSVHGFSVLSYIASHASGDAIRHVGEMHPILWRRFSPLGMPVWLAFAVLVLLGIQGQLLARRLDAPELLLMLLGVLLANSAVRFASEASLLCAPLALRGLTAAGAHLNLNADSSPRAGLFLAIAVLGIGALLLWSRNQLTVLRGPMLEVGLDMDAFPARGTRALLRLLPKGSNVLTDYEAGSAVGLWADGRIRTYIDGRSQMYFDDTDFAVSRDVLREPAAFWRAALRYDARAAVVDRSTAVCDALASRWSLVAIDARYSTFVRDAIPQALSGVRACGDEYLVAEACGRRERLDATLAALSQPQSGSLAQTLRSLARLRCDHDPRAALAQLPPAHRAWSYRAQYALLRAEMLLAAGSTELGIDAVEAAVATGQAGAAAFLLPIVEQGKQLPRLRAIYDAAISQLDDAAPASLRAQLALICLGLNDHECARFHGLRAAALGAREVAPVLQWLATTHPSPVVRRDAEGWLRAMVASEPAPVVRRQ